VDCQADRQVELGFMVAFHGLFQLTETTKEYSYLKKTVIFTNLVIIKTRSLVVSKSNSWHFHWCSRFWAHAIVTCHSMSLLMVQYDS